MDHLFDMRPDRPGYRLHRLEVFNWGTFDSSDGAVFRFEPEGRTSLLVGHNGSGKSTLVDAILTLLVDSRTRNYNVAAGAKKTERTAKSYIRGAYGRKSDEIQSSIERYLRPQANHLTAIAAVFEDEQLGRAFTLTQILYLKADGSDDRVFALADEPHELKLDLAGLSKSDQIREHLKECGYQTTKVYVEYQRWLVKRTGMRDKAIDMFNQTVAVRDIQKLNTFIRDHMLERHDWQDKVQRLLVHFNDLSLAHRELVRARQAVELLTPVETIGAKYRKRAQAITKCEQELAAAESYFPAMTLDLFDPELAKQRQYAQAMAADIKKLDDALCDTRETTRQLRNEIEQAGGERLKRIPGLIATEEAHLAHKRPALAQFQGYLRACGVKRSVGDRADFERARQEIEQTIERVRQEIEQLDRRHEGAIGERAGVDRELREEREELAALEGRRTSLPSRLASVRSQICRDLNLDEAVLPFAAELIAVTPEERAWEASIEMVLRPLALSLLVPEKFYARVRAYVEQSRLADGRGEGQRLDYLAIGPTTGKAPAGRGEDRIDPRSLLGKLQFKPRHDLAPWLRGEVLRRYDFRCCEGLQEFNDAPRLALTANRHVKYNQQKHQKDDRRRAVDPRNFVLGWDNAEKRRRIAEHIKQLQTQHAELTAQVAGFATELESLRSVRQSALTALAVGDYDAIDASRHEAEIARLEVEKKALEDSNEKVKALQRRLQESLATEQRLHEDRDARFADKTRLEGQIEQVETMLQRARGELAHMKAAGDFERHEAHFDEITASLGKTPLSTTNFAMRQVEWEKEHRAKLDKLREPLQRLTEQLVTAMSRYLRDFKEEAADLDAAAASLDGFLAILEQLRKEGLPRHEKKFKDRLNDQVSQEVALFNTELRSECKQIESRIAQLNEALASVEYSPGAFMRLQPRSVQDREIDEFRRSLRECLDEALEHTDQANEARFLRVQALVERLADKERTTWRNKVIDVRNWFDFAAQEVDRETGEVRSSYDGSSGQSGGEKAKLAYTILVAALAYQFDINPTGDTPGRFQFVVVDEMFSKVDDENARYALRLFQQFGLQLLIVAPFDAKARVTEPFVDRYLLVTKDQRTSRSQFNCMTAREYDELVLQLAPSGGAGERRRSAK